MNCIWLTEKTGDAGMSGSKVGKQRVQGLATENKVAN